MRNDIKMASHWLIPSSTVRWGLLCCLGMISLAVGQTTQLPDSVIGIYIGADGNSFFLPCPDGDTYTTNGSFAYCCPSTAPSCNYATTCGGTSAVFNDGGRGWCGDGLTCASMTIFDKSPSATKSWTQYWCWTSNFKAHTLYREIAAATTSSTTRTSATSQTAQPASSNWLSEASNTSYDDYASMDTEESASKAWIAGAVIGPLIALVALGAFAFWYRRRKQQTEKTGGKYSPQFHDDGYNQPYSVSDPPRYEVCGNSSSTSPSWQGGTHRPVSELESVATHYTTPLLEAP